LIQVEEAFSIVTGIGSGLPSNANFLSLK